MLNKKNWNTNYTDLKIYFNQIFNQVCLIDNMKLKSENVLTATKPQAHSTINTGGVHIS